MRPGAGIVVGVDGCMAVSKKDDGLFYTLELNYGVKDIGNIRGDSGSLAPRAPAITWSFKTDNPGILYHVLN